MMLQRQISQATGARACPFISSGATRRDLRRVVVPRVAAPPSGPHATSNGSSASRPQSSQQSSGSTLYTPANLGSTQSSGPLASMSGEAPAACMATLLLACPDQKGVIAAVAQLLFGFGCNVVSGQ